MDEKEIDEIIKQAYEKAVQTASSFDFDPQGRILVTLDAKDEVDPPIIVSVDIMGNSILEELFKQKFNFNFSEIQEQRGSIIPLYQEFYFHLKLVAKLYNSSFSLTSSHIETALANVMKKLNIEIFKYLEDIPPPVTVAEINKRLNKARGELAPRAHEWFKEELGQYNSDIEKDNSKDLLSKTIKQYAKNLPATKLNILHVDNQHNLATWIEGSKYTSHYREKGKDFAHREIKFYSLDAEKNLTKRKLIRTPSLAVKKGLTELEYIEDVAIKINKLVTTYNINQNFVYNLFTAINDTSGDLGGNLQTQSAEHILKGAHLYNKIKASSAPACYVQNISVNGFGDTLGYKFRSSIIREAALMTELALLLTLKLEDHGEIFKLYDNYLEKLLSRTDPYFADTKGGKDAINKIKKFKEDLQNKVFLPTENKHELAKYALAKMMAFDLHFSHKYSKLFQTLSIFCEEVSVCGCKSGNERTQSIFGRLEALETLQDPKIFSALQELAAATTSSECKKAAKNLQFQLDTLYNAEYLQTFGPLIALADQGGPAKVEAKPNRPFFSRNYAEENASIMTNLHQSNASKLQAHKGLKDLILGTWKPFWVKLVEYIMGTTPKEVNIRADSIDDDSQLSSPLLYERNHPRLSSISDSGEMHSSDNDLSNSSIAEMDSKDEDDKMNNSEEQRSPKSSPSG